MQISQYIIVKGKKKHTYSSYRRYSSRMSKGVPSLDADEVAVKINLELPDALFDKPSLEAKIVVPKEAVSKPVISADVIDNVQDIIKQNTGFDVRLELIEKEPKKKK